MVLPLILSPPHHLFFRGWGYLDAIALHKVPFPLVNIVFCVIIVLASWRKDGMPTQEDRIAALEQTTVSRIDFLNAVNKLTLQQAQNASDTYHELTILLGVIGSQGKDIKIIIEDVSTLKEDVSTLKEDVSDIKRQVASLEGKLEQVLQILMTLPGTNK